MAALQPPWAAGRLCACSLPTIWWKEEAPGASPAEPPAGWRGLKFFNSFTRTKVPFVPLSGNRVGWYICGPTVYDSSHLGHARNYVSFDILRRVLTNYFGYDVTFVENVTDIDDKIILRTHKTRAGLVLVAGEAGLSTLSGPSKEEAAAAVAALKALVDADSKSIAQLSEAASRVVSLVTAALGPEACKAEAFAPLVAPWDVQIEYLMLARKYENEFFEDMRDLGVAVPDVLTRVSEYVGPVIEYIQKLIGNGYAYAANGSVYFDVGAFMKQGEFKYGKLKQNPLDDVEAAMDGEGALVGDSSEKRSQSDFVLWKSSKEGEPQWASPWGAGRPGWHIECSAMCSDILGGAVDINCGGVDLAFPHHENQLAQSEAYWETPQWVNFFLHTGHLHIEGRKMSKSLKNFITIQATLQKYSARQMRLLFLLQHWAEPMELKPIVGPDGEAAGFLQFEPAVSADKTFAEFFFAVQALVRSKGGMGYESGPAQGWEGRERELAGALEEGKRAVHDALCDNVDTVSAVKALLALVRACNSYTNAPFADGTGPRVMLVVAVARYVTRILAVFGVAGDADPLGLGGAPDGAGASRQDVLAPYLDSICGFRRARKGEGHSISGHDRDKIRALVRAKAEPGEVLRACDELRDLTLPQLGVKLDDAAGGGGALWKLYDPEELKAELAREAEAKAAKEEALKLKKEEAARKAAEKEAKARVPPAEMFRGAEYAGQFKEYDDSGFPTVMADDQPVSKGMVKKLQKAREAQVKAYEQWQAAAQKDGGVVAGAAGEAER